jgi:sodium/potassium/calcium exchanger 5
VILCQDLYLTGFYFNQFTCECHVANYINPAMQVAQDRPVFDTLQACQQRCFKKTTAGVGCTCAAGVPTQCSDEDGMIENPFPKPFGDNLGIGKDCKGEGLHPSACHEASLVEGMEEEFGDEGEYCKTSSCTALLFVLNLFALLMCFLALAIICDDFLVPPIELFCDRYRIPDEAAGASFLAFGSSAPEIVIATIATLSGGGEGGGEGGSETGLSTVLGSAVLAFGLIPAVSAILAPPADAWDVATVPPELYKGGLLLEMAPLVRDVGFAIVGFAMIFLFGNDGEIVTWEACVLVLGFFVYMAVIFVPIKLAEMKNKSAAGGSTMESAEGGTEDLGLPQDDDDDEPDGALAQAFGKVIGVCSGPIEWLCEFTIPHEPEEGEDSTMWFGVIEIGWEKSWYMLGFVVSLCYVAVLSDLILVFAKFCCDTIGMSEDLEGVTVLAWGAQVPDCLASISMAKKGLGPGAVANAVGSQIINVFIGLGLPYAIAGSSPLNTAGVSVYLGCLMVVMVSFVGLCLFAMFYQLPWYLGGTSYQHSKKATQPILTPKSAWILCLIWALCNVVIVFSEGGNPDECGVELRHITSDD